MRSPCYMCEERKALCHVDCERYLEFVRGVMRAREARKAQGEDDATLWEAKKRMIKRRRHGNNE